MVTRTLLSATERRFERLTHRFQPPWPRNQHLFEIYVRHRKKQKIFFETICFTEQVMVLLSREEFPEFKSWFDVYDYSVHRGLGPDKKNPRKGCPIVYLATLLQNEGELAKSPKCYTIFQCFQSVPLAARESVRKYYFIQLKAFHLDVAIRRLNIICEYAIWHGGNLFESRSNEIQNYIFELSKNVDTTTVVENISVLRRLFEWAYAVHGTSQQNPVTALDLSSMYRLCPLCQKRKFLSVYAKGCRLCEVEKRLMVQIENFEKHLTHSPEYNRYLFKLYLDYIRRHRIDFSSWDESKKLVMMLKTENLAPLLSWEDVKHASLLFRESLNGRKIRKGCPLIKIGARLAELGVIPNRDEDEMSHLKRTLARLPDQLQPITQRYLKNLLQRHRRPRSAEQITLRILYFANWVEKEHTGQDPLTIGEHIAAAYVRQVRPGSRLSHHGTLRKFFRFCIREKLCFENPFEAIKRLKPAAELPICSPEQMEQLVSYLKSPANDPSRALMLALVLFWGFHSKQVRLSTFKVKDNGEIEISVFQPILSYAHRSKTRGDTFTLPKSPKWFSDLQDRYSKNWQLRFTKLFWTDGLRPLFPLPSARFNRAMSRTIFFEQIQLATKEATGKAIPFQVLRCTAGHVHTLGADASLLTLLGWAPASAFRYTWVPRKFAH